MPLEGLQWRSRACVPEPDGIVVRSGCQQLTVRREGHGVDPESCPSRVCSGAPEPASQSLTVLLSEADASSLPSGEKATALTQSHAPRGSAVALPSLRPRA